MLDKNKVYQLLARHISICESSLYGADPNPEHAFRIPMCEALSENIGETITFLEARISGL